MKDLGTRVAALRELRDISQKDLAKLMGTERAWISKLERGVLESITTGSLERLANALKTTPAKLLR